MENQATLTCDEGLEPATLPNSSHEIQVVSDESTNKQFSQIAQTHLLAEWNRGITGKVNHIEDRKRLARSFKVTEQRILV
jgi:hypothetical protein